MNHKTELCKHNDSCIVNCLKGVLRGVLIAVGVRVVINLVKSVPFKLFREPLSLGKFSYSDLRFSLFLSGMISAQRCVLCALRAFTNNEKISSFVSGFISGFPLAFENPANRTFYSLYILTRAIETLLKYLVSQKKLPFIPYSYEVLYSISLSTIIMIKVYNTDCLNSAILSLVYKLFQSSLDYVQIDMKGISDKLVNK